MQIFALFCRKDAQMKNIIEALENAKNFKILVEIIKATGMADIMTEAGPYTLFAPNDEAFKRLPADVFNGFKKDMEAMRTMVKRHVADGAMHHADVLKMQTIKTIDDGYEIKVLHKKNLYIDNSRVIKVDLLSDNGIIHTMDSVTTYIQTTRIKHAHH